MTPNLPTEFQAFADELNASARPSVPFTLSTEATQLWDSKVGGLPYLPKGAAYPRNPDDEPLFFLAQINFAQMPPLPDFPTTGIVQFYIDGKDDCYGVNFENYQDRSRYKIIYHADVVEDAEQLQHNFDFVQFDEYDCGIPFSAGHEHKIHFQAAELQIITQQDCHFGEIVPKLATFLDEISENRQYDWALHEQYDALSAAETHRVGGYPYFTQDDVRGYGYHDDLQDDVLLFQLVSDWGAELMWGDCGVGNFFIHPDDLKNRVFDNVWFTMDCC